MTADALQFLASLAITDEARTKIRIALSEKEETQ